MREDSFGSSDGSIDNTSLVNAPSHSSPLNVESNQSLVGVHQIFRLQSKEIDTTGGKKGSSHINEVLKLKNQKMSQDTMQTAKGDQAQYVPSLFRPRVNSIADFSAKAAIKIPRKVRSKEVNFSIELTK